MAKPVPTSAEPFLPPKRTLGAMRAAVDACRGCELYRHATQAVFGEGPRDARIMLVGEMPGDDEDRAGRPFVGPAGTLLDRGLADAGLDRLLVYITNAVKHFNFENQRGIRLHKTPKGPHIDACRPWLTEEIAAVKPRVIVAMGATACRSVFGRAVVIKNVRDDLHDHASGARIVATIHPSAILRMPERERRHEAFERFVDDLRKAKKAAR